MTAAVYRWLLGLIEDITGPDALILGGVIAFIAAFVGMALVGIWSMVAEPIKRRAAQIRSRLARWHAAQVRRASEPVPYGLHDATAWRLPLLTELAIVALIVGLMVACGVTR